jgi:hypothetical protein
MIRIDNITRGRFGNKILQYNNLIQLSKKYNVEISCKNFPESKYFVNIVSFKKTSKPIKDLSYKMILDNEPLIFKNFSYKIDDPNYLLHNVFFQLTNINPRKFIQLKPEYQVKVDNNFINVGIHFRGGDKQRKTPHEIHTTKYYIDSINEINKEYKNTKFILCTDDNTFKIFKQVVNYCNNNKINFELGPNTKNNKNDKESNDKYIYDFSILCDCDIIINSSSTFCICAGFLGKENKKMIFSKEWIQKNIKHIKWGHSGMPDRFWKSFDNFWIKLSEGGNDFLKPWKII